MTARDILKSFYQSAGVRRAVASASARLGCECGLRDNPHGGVVMCDLSGDPVVVAMTEVEAADVRIELGRAFAKLVRL